MPVEYVDFEEAREAAGLRMVVVSGVPSPWGEAAKGLLHVKGSPWKAVRLDPHDDALRTAFSHRDAETSEALDPVLLEHRDFVYAEYLELPLSL